MTTWSPDTCDCTLSDERGRLEFDRRCARHRKATAQEVAAECKAKNDAVGLVQAELGLAMPPEWVRADDGKHEVLIPDEVSAKARAALEAKLADTGLATRTVSEFLTGEMERSA